MKKTVNLLNEAIEMGFDREKALESIDACIDDAVGVENRLSLEDEFIADELYDDILAGFKEERETDETFDSRRG